MTFTDIRPSGLVEIGVGELELGIHGLPVGQESLFALTSPEDRQAAVYYDIIKDKIDTAIHDIDNQPEKVRRSMDGPEFILPIPVHGRPVELTRNSVDDKTDVYALLRFQNRRMPSPGAADCFIRMSGVTYFKHHHFERDADGIREYRGWPQPIDPTIKKVLAVVFGDVFRPKERLN